MLAKEKSSSKSKSININLSNCKYDILKSVAKESNYQIVDDNSDWALFWIDTGVSLERILDMKSFQKINHFPGMHEICRKDHLARKVSLLSRKFPKDYNFFPKSWILPGDLADFKSSFKPKKGQCFISKPDHGSQGKGIFLFKDPSELNNLENIDMVVQSYISSPCLIDGYKFDFRVYVLVTSMNPLRVFVYKDGLARFATEPYQVPSKRNLDQICMHLTNYAINKNSKDFIRDDEKGSKRTIQAVLDELESKNGIDKDTIWKKIQDVVVKTILIVQPALSRLVKPWFPTDQKSSFNHFGSQCFEILGFDILLDSKLKPWVLEVNHSPSFTCDALLDKEIKFGVIKDALNLLSLNSSSPKRYLRDQKAKSLNRLLKSQKGGSSKSKGTPTQDTISSKGALNDIGSSEITLNNSQTDLLSNEAEENATNCNSKTSEKRLELQKKSLERYYRKYNPAILKKFEEWENSRLGNYDRVFPPDDPSLLSKYTYLMEETSQFSTETNSTKIRKAFLETKIQEEISKSRRLTQWKAKQQQKTNHISAKVSTTQNKLANFQANLSMTHILTLKRADYAYQLHQDAGCISPTPTSLSAVGSAKKYKQTIDVKIQNLSDCFVKPSDRFHFLKPPIQSRSTGPKKVVNYADLLSMNPLIKAKQLELTMTKTEVHNRRRNHRQSLYQIPFSP